MEVTDSAKAREALTVIAMVFFAEVALVLLGTALPAVVGALGGEDSLRRIYGAQQVLWLMTSIAFAVAVFILTRAVRENELLFALLGAIGLLGCIEVFWGYEAFTGEHHRIEWLGWASMALGLGMSLGLCAVVGKLGRSTPFASGIGVFIVLRALAGLGLRLSHDYTLSWAYTLLSFFGIVISISMGVLALRASKVVGAPAPSGDAAALPPPITEASGMRLVLTGVALLVLGIGGTALSYSVAASGSGGGRYIIATGAIATGLVQLVRGLGKLGSGK